MATEGVRGLNSCIQTETESVRLQKLLGESGRCHLCDDGWTRTLEEAYKYLLRQSPHSKMRPQHNSEM